MRRSSRVFLRGSLREFLLGGALALGLASAQSASNPPSTSGIVNAANNGSRIGIRSWITVYGSNLSNCTTSDSSLPTAISCTDANGNTNAVIVTLDGTPLQLNYVSPGQINALTPNIPGTGKLVVSNGGVASAAQPLVVNQTGLGLFNADHVAAAINNPAGTIHGPGAPIAPGDPVSIYATGCGPTTSTQQYPTGSGTITLENTQIPAVRLNGVVSGAVLYAGMAPGLPGVCQFNIGIPNALPAGAYTITLSLNDGTDVVGDSADIFIALDGSSTAAGVVRSPGVMSDGIKRPLESIVGTATSDLGTNQFSVTPNGHYLAFASGSTTLDFAGNDSWEHYHEEAQDATTVKGNTVFAPIAAFPHVVYTDVKGNYNRDTRTWDTTSYDSTSAGGWLGTPGGGPVTLFDMVHSLATNGLNPACMETVIMWPRANTPIKVFIDPTNQPYYDAVTNNLITGSPPPDAISGLSATLQVLAASPGLGGPAFQSIDHDPLAVGENGIEIQFLPNIGLAGGSSIYPYYHNLRACGLITSAFTEINPAIDTLKYFRATIRHEVSRDTGYGSSSAPTSTSSPFGNDNMVQNGYTPNFADSWRDLDGRKMIEFFRDFGYPAADLRKYAK